MTTDLQIAAPQVNVEIDRDKAAALGVTPQQIENGLYDAYGERQSSTIYADVAEYWVVFEVLPQFQLDPEALAQLYITSSATGTNGMPKLIPLSAVAKLTRTVGPDEHFARRTIAVSDNFLQPRAGHVARNRRRAIAKS